MPTMKRPPLSQECIEARIVLRVAQLRELLPGPPANTGASARAPTASMAAPLPQRVALDAAVHNLRKLRRERPPREKSRKWRGEGQEDGLIRRPPSGL